MGVADVTARIAAIESRIAELASAVRPSVPAAPSAGVPNFAAVLGAASSAPSVPGVPAASSLAGTTGAAAFSAVDRPSFGAVAQAAQVSSDRPNASGALSAGELRAVLEQAGFSGESLRVAYALARRESGGRPEALSPANSNGTRDHGLFQINDVHRAADWIDFERIYDPVYNAQVAFRMSGGGENFSAWGLGDSGWAGHLQRSSPDTYASLLERFRDEYAKYPFA